MKQNATTIQEYFGKSLNICNLVLKGLTGRLERSQLETLSIMFNSDHFEMILQSLQEERDGQIVSMDEAFADIYTGS